MGVPTNQLRSGDRLLPTVMVSGLSLKTIAEFADPFVELFMKYMNQSWAVQFTDPEGWKNSALDLFMVLGTAAIAYLHMRYIRNSDLANNDNNAGLETKLGE